MTVLQAFYALCIVFIACELCERLTIAYAELEQKIEQFEWYAFPIKAQRLLPILMLNAQQPITLQCFGGISTNREAFKKVHLWSSENSKKKNTDFFILINAHFRWWIRRTRTTRCFVKLIRNIDEHPGLHFLVSKFPLTTISQIRLADQQKLISIVKGKAMLWCTSVFDRP